MGGLNQPLISKPRICKTPNRNPSNYSEMTFRILHWCKGCKNLQPLNRQLFIICSSKQTGIINHDWKLGSYIFWMINDRCDFLSMSLQYADDLCCVLVENSYILVRSTCNQTGEKLKYDFKILYYVKGKKNLSLNTPTFQHIKSFIYRKKLIHKNYGEKFDKQVKQTCNNFGCVSEANIQSQNTRDWSTM